jgi:hypothetical protein
MGLLLVKAEATIAGSFQRTHSALALSEGLKVMYNLQSYNLTFRGTVPQYGSLHSSSLRALLLESF